MMKHILVLIGFTALLGLTACSDTPGAQRALQNLGMTDIVIEGFSFWGCSDRDTYTTKFRAKNPQGNTVSGVVCAGTFKGSTVRFY